jgi:hypothetical protein
MRHALLALAVAFSAAPAQALVSVSCDSLSQVDPDGPGDPIVDDESSDAGSCTTSIVTGAAAVNSEGEAGIGSFLARAEANILDGAVDDADTFTRVQFRDTITVDSPGLTGQFVTVKAEAAVSGVLDVTGIGEATARLDVITSPGGISEVFREQCILGVSCFDSFEPYPRIVQGAYEVSFDIRVGTATILGLSLTTGAGRSSSLLSDPGSALSDFSGGGSLAWSGITSVEQNGTPVPYTVTSESGTDWTQPVPEPGATAAALAALLALWAKHHR